VCSMLFVQAHKAFALTFARIATQAFESNDSATGTTAAAEKTGGISLFQRRSTVSSPKAPPVPPAVTPKPSNTLEQDIQAPTNRNDASKTFEMNPAPKRPPTATQKSRDLRQILVSVAANETNIPSISTPASFEGVSLKTPFPKVSTTTFTLPQTKLPAVTPGTNPKPANPSMASNSHKLLATENTTTLDTSFLPESDLERDIDLASARNENVAPPEKDDIGKSLDDMHQTFMDSLRDFDDYDNTFGEGLLEMDVDLNTEISGMLGVQSSLFDYMDAIDSSADSARRVVRDCIEA